VRFSARPLCEGDPLAGGNSARLPGARDRGLCFSPDGAGCKEPCFTLLARLLSRLLPGCQPRGIAVALIGSQPVKVWPSGRNSPDLQTSDSLLE